MATQGDAPAYAGNLKDLLRLALAEPAHWLVESRSEPVIVSWVTGSLDELKGGDVCVLPGGQASMEVVNLAGRLGAAALIFAGEIPAGEILFDLDQPSGSMPVLVASNMKEPRNLQQALLVALIDQRAALLERGARLHAQLSQLAARGEGLQRIAQAMGEISGRGVIIQDKRGQVLAQHSSSSMAETWNDVLAQLSSFSALPDLLHDRSQAGQLSSALRQEIPGELERIVQPITVNQIARGYISLVGLAHELDALDYVIIGQGCLVCALDMSRGKAVRETEKRLKGDLLTALLMDDLHPRDAALWLQTMGIDLDQPYAALRLAWSGSAPPSLRRLETIVNGEVARLKLNVLTDPMAPEIVCFCQTAPEKSRPEAALQLGIAVLGQASGEYPRFPVYCGVGSPVKELYAWRDSFRQAGQALEMARRLGESKPLYFPDLSIYRLLLQLELNPELTTFEDEILRALLAHEGSAEFLRTLEAYFERNGNISQTAEALYIHRNTLLYRIDRIQEIINLDLDESNARLAVQLALMIHKMRGSFCND